MTYKYIQKLINLEKNRQSLSINLIASENYLLKEYSNIDYSILVNKYAEGYNGARYYSGCQYIDKIESHAIDTCKKLFNTKYVNVQPHSGSQANQAVYMALCKKDDIIMGLSLKDGGHLSHGVNVNFSGHFYKYINYKLNDDFFLDYDNIEKIIHCVKPRMLVAGYSAYSRLINWNVLKSICNSYNVILLADISHVAGLVSSKIYPSPIGIADVITFTLHKTLRGPRGAVILTDNESIYCLINKAVFPGIQGGPFLDVLAKKSICFKLAALERFRIYQKNVIRNTKMLAKYMINRGFNIVSNGTDSHLFLVDLKTLKISGIEAEKLLEKANIFLNRNSIPGDKKQSSVCSGIRIGTPAISARGFGIYEMYLLSDWLYQILIEKTDPLQIQGAVIKLCRRFPLDI